MKARKLLRRLVAEFVGTALLVTSVVGSEIIVPALPCGPRAAAPGEPSLGGEP